MTGPQQLDRKAAHSLHDQLFAIMRQMISESAPGRKLPSENQLSQKYHISRDTAARVLARLEDENLVVRRRGAGTFVPDRPVFTFLLPCHNFLTGRDPGRNNIWLEMQGCMMAAAEKGMILQTVVASRTNHFENPDPDCLNHLTRFSKVIAMTWYYRLFPVLQERQCEVSLRTGLDLPYGYRTPTRNWITLNIDRSEIIRRLMERFIARGARKIALIAPFLLSEKNHAYTLAYRKVIREHRLPEIILEIPQFPTEQLHEELRSFYRKWRYDALLFRFIPKKRTSSIGAFVGAADDLPAAGLYLRPEHIPCEMMPECYAPDFYKMGYDAVTMLADYEKYRRRSFVYRMEKVEMPETTEPVLDCFAI